MKVLTIAILTFTLCSLFISPSSGAGASSSANSYAKSETGTSSDKDSLKNLREGFPLILECKIQKKGKDDALKVLWFKDNKQIMPDDHPDQEHFKILENSNLTIAKANSTRDIGLYRCQALDNPDAKPFEINVFHLVFKKLPKSITVLQGDKLSISCDVGGTSKPTVAWSWKKESGNVDEAGVNGSRHHFVENDNHVPNATFVINEAQYDDRGYYTCFIQMEGINISNSTTYVRVKDMYAALWPFLGICVEVIILCLIIFIYEKRRAKADFEESDTDQPPEQKNKQDENKDVRQRK